MSILFQTNRNEVKYGQYQHKLPLAIRGNERHMQALHINLNSVTLGKLKPELKISLKCSLDLCKVISQNHNKSSKVVSTRML